MHIVFKRLIYLIVLEQTGYDLSSVQFVFAATALGKKLHFTLFGRTDDPVHFPRQQREKHFALWVGGVFADVGRLLVIYRTPSSCSGAQSRSSAVLSYVSSGFPQCSWNITMCYCR